MIEWRKRTTQTNGSVAPISVSLKLLTSPWGFASFRAEDINPPHHAYPRAVPVCPSYRFLRLACPFPIGLTNALRRRRTVSGLLGSEECKAGTLALFSAVREAPSESRFSFVKSIGLDPARDG
jgi:hypothetical protein